MAGPIGHLLVPLLLHKKASAAATATPSVVASTWTVPAPTSVGANATATPSAVASTWTVPSPTVTASATKTPTTVASAWTVPSPTPTTAILYDDFPGSSIDSSKWVVYDRLGDMVNSEVDAVIPANVRVSSGSLLIDSKFEDVSAGDTTTGAPNPRTVHYTSGQVAQKSPAFLYGDIQVRAKLPGGTGLWPCIWMLGYQWQPSQPYTANVVGADWPNGGWWEVDIAEFMLDHRTVVNNALHFITANRGGSGEKTLPYNATSRFMVYRLIWTPTSMTWQVDPEDGSGWATTLTITGTAGTDIPNTPGYLIIHTAVGGAAATTPNPATFPLTFEVDYAKILATSDTVPPTVTPPTLTATWTVPSPTITASATKTPATVSSAWTVPAPTESASGTPTPSSVSSTWTVPAPTITASALVQPATVASAWTVPSPSVNTGGGPTPATVAATWTVPAPAVTATALVAPSSVASTWTVPGATITATALVTPGAVAVVWAVPAPTVVTGGSPLPATVASAWTVPSPVIVAAALITPTSVTVVWTVPAPTLISGTTPTPTTVTAVWTVPAAIGKASGTVNPTTVAAIWLVGAVTIGGLNLPGFAAISVLAPTLLLSVLAPSLTITVEESP